jgi:hypothetical protein
MQTNPELSTHGRLAPKGSKSARSKSRRSYVFLVHVRYAFAPPSLVTIWANPGKARNFIKEHVERSGGSITEFARHTIARWGEQWQTCRQSTQTTLTRTTVRIGMWLSSP